MKFTINKMKISDKLTKSPDRKYHTFILICWTLISWIVETMPFIYRCTLSIQIIIKWVTTMQLKTVVQSLHKFSINLYVVVKLFCFFIKEIKRQQCRCDLKRSKHLNFFFNSDTLSERLQKLNWQYKMKPNFLPVHLFP